jgi:type I restriction enzyme S subunit
MSVVQLGELMATQTPGLNPAQFQDEEFELWSIPAFDAGRPERLLGSEIGSAKKVVQPGDVLLSRIVPHIRRSWVVSKSSDGLRQIGSGEWIIFRSKRFDPNYLRHFLISDVFHPQFMQTVAGVGGSLLRARPEGVKEISFYLPPLEEQKRIAAILDQADELRRKRQRALDRLNQLGQAIFIEMFGDPMTNPMGWSVTQLGEIVRSGDRINYGVVQPGDEVESGVPLIRVGDLLRPFIDRSLVKHIDPAIESNYARSRLAGDEILIGCVGSIGAVALAHPGLAGANVARAVARVPADDSKADRRFLAAMIRSPLVQRYFTAETRTVAQPTLNIGLIVAAPILLPPLKLQRQFSLTLDRIEPIAKALTSGTVASDRLFTSLQHRAFRGELTAHLKEAAA